MLTYFNSAYQVRTTASHAQILNVLRVSQTQQLVRRALVIPVSFTVAQLQRVPVQLDTQITSLLALLRPTIALSVRTFSARIAKATQ
jgi:hypothetical protein